MMSRRVLPYIYQWTGHLSSYSRSVPLCSSYLPSVPGCLNAKKLTSLADPPRNTLVTLTTSRNSYPVLFACDHVEVRTQRHKGHSKWQNIRHIKAAKDDLKQRTTSDILRKLRVAAVGGFDPKLNKKVADILEEGKQKAVPKNVMTEFLKKLENSKDSAMPVLIEVKGPGQSLLLIQAITNKPHTVINNVRAAAKKCLSQVGDRKGFATFGFDHRGMIGLENVEGLTLDGVMDIAIECEAEEAREGEDEEGNKEFQLLCGADEVFQLKARLEKQSVKIKKVDTLYEPKDMVTLDPIHQELMEKFFSKLDLIDEIEVVYDNLAPPEKS